MDPSDRLDSPTALSDHDRGLVIRRRSSDTLMPRECCRCRVRARLGSRSRSRSNLSHPDSVLVLGFSFPFPRRLGRRRSSCCCCRFFLLPRRVIQIQRLLVPRNGSERGNPRGRVVGVVSLWDWRSTREGLTGRRDGESAGETAQGLGRGGEGRERFPRGRRLVRDVRNFAPSHAPCSLYKAMGWEVSEKRRGAHSISVRQ